MLLKLEFGKWHNMIRMALKSRASHDATEIMHLTAPFVRVIGELKQQDAVMKRRRSFTKFLLNRVSDQ